MGLGYNGSVLLLSGCVGWRPSAVVQGAHGCWNPPCFSLLLVAKGRGHAGGVDIERMEASCPDRGQWVGCCPRLSPNIYTMVGKGLVWCQLCREGVPWGWELLEAMGTHGLHE